MSTPEEFIRERMYLKGVTEATVQWYRVSFKRFEGALESKSAIVQRISELQKTNSATSINTFLRCLNAYFKWLHKEHNRPLLHIPKLKEEQKVMQILTSDEVNKLINYKPRTRVQHRVHMITLVILDTGLRISEVLSLTQAAVDLDQLCLHVKGKGNKERLVPISTELRKELFKFMRKYPGTELVFAIKGDRQMGVRNYLRDFKAIGKQLRIPVRGPHMLRHTFAVMYLKNGGNLEFLRRILGHSSLLTTQRYLKSLGVEDLVNVHGGLSPLSK